MSSGTASALAHPNIAFIKYWGNLDNSLNLPSNGSISMNLGSLQTVTTVQFDPLLTADTLEINQQSQTGPSLKRVQNFMEHIRQLSKSSLFAHIRSESNFPISAGLASSASAYAALALAATAAFGIDQTEKELSSLARLGSGSAARSIPAGFVEWHASETHAGSFAESIAGPNYWDLRDMIVIIQNQPKSTGSADGHGLADTSPFQSLRVENAPTRLEICRQAILERDFVRLAEIVELDSMMMHAVMMTSRPPLFYWEPVTLQIIKSVQDWRRDGLQVCVTVDAGSNLHLICPLGYTQMVTEMLKTISGIQSVMVSPPGGSAHLI